MCIRDRLECPLMGLGIAGDRFVLGGTYSHNMFIELLADYGVVIGSFAILLILALISRVFFWKDMRGYSLSLIHI